MHRCNLVLLLPGLVTSVRVGVVTQKDVDENLVHIVLGTIVMLVALTYFTLKSATDGGTKLRHGLGVVYIGISGFTRFVADAGDQLVVFYLVSQRLALHIFGGT